MGLESLPFLVTITHWCANQIYQSWRLLKFLGLQTLTIISTLSITFWGWIAQFYGRRLAIFLVYAGMVVTLWELGLSWLSSILQIHFDHINILAYIPPAFSYVWNHWLAGDVLISSLRLFFGFVASAWSVRVTWTSVKAFFKLAPNV